MIKYGNKYIELNDYIEGSKNNKAPKYNFETYITTPPDNYSGLALLIEKPYVVVDVDDMLQAQKLINLLELDNKSYGLMKTDNGYHFWFKTNETYKNYTKFKSCLGIVIDIKCSGNKSMAVVKLNNIYREWIKQPDNVDIIPDYLIPYQFNEEVDFSSVPIGERHNYMLKNVVRYKSVGLSTQQIYDMYVFLNKHVMQSDLDEADIKAMTINNNFLDEIKPQGNSKMSTEAMALQLVTLNKYHLDDDNNLYIWNGLRYEHSSEGYLERTIFNNFPYLNSSNRKEVLLKIKLLVESDVEKYAVTNKLGRHEVVFKNCILDMYTRKVREITSDCFYTNIIPHEYDANVTNEHVERVLDKVTLKNSEVRELILQMIAYTMTQGQYFQKCFMLLGEGSNGKSVILSMIQALHQNYSTVPLSQFNNQNALYSMVGKPVNTVDDMGNRMPMNDTFKSIVTGMPVTVKKLYSDITNLTLTTKLIFGANEMPNTKDKSLGGLRRWIIIPFEASFTRYDDDYDPYIVDKVTTPEAIQALINMAVKEYQNLIDNGGFIETEASQDAEQEYKEDLANPIAWLKDNLDLVGMDIYTCYQNYLDWCKQVGNVFPNKMKTFEKHINQYTDHSFTLVKEYDRWVLILQAKKHIKVDNFLSDENLEKYLGMTQEEIYKDYCDYELGNLTLKDIRKYIRNQSKFEFRNTTVNGIQKRVLRVKLGYGE